MVSYRHCHKHIKHTSFTYTLRRHDIKPPEIKIILRDKFKNAEKIITF